MAIATPRDIAGFDYDLVDPLPDRLLCKICHFPSRDPYLSVCCGHLFCKSCLDNVEKAPAIGDECPVCRDEEFVTFPNKSADREIKCLRVYCTNKVMGCEWQGEMNDVSYHLRNNDGCQFEVVNCFNQCGKMIQRRFLTIHANISCLAREVSCQYCHDRGEYKFIEGQHKEECPKVSLPCPNKCEVWSVPREDMEAHRKECPLEVIQCQYYGVGCDARMTRKDQEKHNKENMEEHLMRTNRALADIKCELSNTKQDLVSTTHKLTNATNQLAVALQRIKTLEALMYLTTDKAVTMATTSAAVIESSLGWSVKLAAMAMLSASGDQVCPVTLKMSDFNNLKKNNVAWYSNSYYTHDRGYKMRMQVHPAGYGPSKGTHLTCSLFLMKGPHDDNLSWPFRGKFEIKLLNQISDSHHHADTVSYNDNTSGDYNARVTESNHAKKGRGKPQFIFNEDLNKTTTAVQFVKDGCLFFQITKV